MKSIQRRLSLGLISVMVVVGVVLAQTSLWLFEAGLQRYLEAGLRNDAENLLVALVRGPNGVQLDEQRLSPAYQRPFSGHYFRIDFANIHWRSRSLWDQELPQLPEAGLKGNLQLGPEGQQLLVLRSDYKRFGQSISISVAQDYTPVRESFRLMRRIGLVLGLAALLLVLFLQRVTVRRALRPLETARNQIAQLQQGQRSQLDTHVPLELEPLVAQINHLLAHTEDSLKRSRNALGNLGHALKTPLAVLLSAASSEALKDHPELSKLLREQLEQVQQRLNRELNRARLAGETLPGALFDCEKELPGLLATLNMIHGEHLDLSYHAASGLLQKCDCFGHVLKKRKLPVHSRQFEHHSYRFVHPHQSQLTLLVADIFQQGHQRTQSTGVHQLHTTDVNGEFSGIAQFGHYGIADDCANRTVQSHCLYPQYKYIPQFFG